MVEKDYETQLELLPYIQTSIEQYTIVSPQNSFSHNDTLIASKDVLRKEFVDKLRYSTNIL